MRGIEEPSLDDPRLTEDEREWEHVGRCPACGVDELDARYDDKTGDTEYVCRHCGYHAMSGCEPDEVQP